MNHSLAPVMKRRPLPAPTADEPVWRGAAESDTADYRARPFPTGQALDILRPRRFRRRGESSMKIRSALALASLLALSLCITKAHASWPPDESAGPVDYKDSNNWPNDPGYSGNWQYWSFTPDKIANQVDART